MPRGESIRPFVGLLNNYIDLRPPRPPNSKGRRIPIPLPNTGAALMRKRSTICFRSVLVFFLFGCVVLQVYILTGGTYQEGGEAVPGLLHRSMQLMKLI